MEKSTQQKHSNTALVKLVSGMTTQVMSWPNKRVVLETPCVGRSCHPTVEYEWKCNRCHTGIEYGFDDHVYCVCGKTPAWLGLEFKCTDPKHGVSYERHDSNFLSQQLSKLRPFSEMNILILGETGVGKSTWINGFINFLTFESLQEAENSDLVTLIPSEFSICGDDYKEVVVRTGVDENEKNEIGQSATQETKVYPFTVGKTIIRLIDTPGIGDTRGIPQDKENFQNILSTISQHQEIHGICILLKPNNARLTVMFRFCIKELLTYLHRDASKNIMFCFTNSRGTFYRPGDTLPALRKLLEENNDVDIPLNSSTIYCYDSEAYRFLSAVKNKPPVTFPEDERENFVRSWQKSNAETHRMLAYIKNLPPHSTKSTLSLNEARQLVLRLARPLAEINRNNLTNKQIIEDRLKEIQDTNASIADLKKKEMITYVDIEQRKLDYPKTVCGHSKCVNVWEVNGVKVTEYKTVCHDHCFLPGVESDSIGDPKLVGCWAMNNGNCRHSNCEHPYTSHLHKYSDSVQVPKQVPDKSVVNLMEQKLTGKEMKEKMIAAKEEEIESYNQESKKIEQCAVKFAYFLKSNAITPYNDAIEQYLVHLIREEENKIQRGGSRDVLDGLKRSMETYTKEKELLEKHMSMESSENVLLPGPKDVKQMVQELKGLPLSGKLLTEALECVAQTQKAVYKEAVVKQPKIKRPAVSGAAKSTKKFDGWFSLW